MTPLNRTMIGPLYRAKYQKKDSTMHIMYDVLGIKGGEKKELVLDPRLRGRPPHGPQIPKPNPGPTRKWVGLWAHRWAMGLR